MHGSASRNCLPFSLSPSRTRRPRLIWNCAMNFQDPATHRSDIATRMPWKALATPGVAALSGRGPGPRSQRRSLARLHARSDDALHAPRGLVVGHGVVLDGPVVPYRYVV